MGVGGGGVGGVLGPRHALDQHAPRASDVLVRHLAVDALAQLRGRGRSVRTGRREGEQRAGGARARARRSGERAWAGRGGGGGRLQHRRRDDLLVDALERARPRRLLVHLGKESLQGGRRVGAAREVLGERAAQRLRRAEGGGRGWRQRVEAAPSQGRAEPRSGGRGGLARCVCGGCWVVRRACAAALPSRCSARKGMSRCIESAARSCREQSRA